MLRLFRGELQIRSRIDFDRKTAFFVDVLDGGEIADPHTLIPVSASELDALALGQLAFLGPVDGRFQSRLPSVSGNAVLRFSRECCIATAVQIECDNLGQAIPSHVKSFTILQALEQSELLLVHLE